MSQKLILEISGISRDLAGDCGMFISMCTPYWTKIVKFPPVSSYFTSFDLCFHVKFMLETIANINFLYHKSCNLSRMAHLEIFVHSR